ncbi:LysR family transcriptional regulator [Streptomyces sp. NPDC001941]|uniref:LysR family transcriptional regulator n=1 Tax=Streptomyces sp. NPDC001941 TaxID=3154659 RepID=UPI00332735E3
MERHEIEAFLTLAEELSFRRATDRLGLAQGRVTQIIQKLERRFGVPLFERTSRRVALTPAGETLRDELLPAYEQVRRAVANAVAVGRGTAVPLQVGYSSPMAADLILRAADRFTERYGGGVQIHEVQLADPFGPIRTGQVQLQVTELPVREDDLVVGTVLFTEERLVMLHRDHPLAHQESVELEELADSTLVVFAGDTPRYWRELHYPRHTPSGRPIAHVEAAYWQEALSMVGAGKGVTFACARAELYYARPDTVWLPFHGAPPIDYGIIWPRHGATPRVKAFIDILETYRAG